ncbi:MAG: AAA family ATPase [Gemmatimonadetes bacterium]|nr:AAA family ATPase [Gemmatimonadota bacterium]
MATSQDRNLTLSVKDFGPIYSAEVELRPLTVFVGPSNTGKSYLAILIYALHKFFNSSRTMNLSFFHRHRGLLDEHEISEEDITRLIDGVDEIVSRVNDGSPIPLPDEVASLIRPMLSDVLLGDDLAPEIMRCFGIDETRKLIRHGSEESAKVALLSKTPDSPETGYNYSPLYKFDIKKETLPASIPDTAPLQIGKDAIEEYIQIKSEIKSFGPKWPNSQERRFLAVALIENIFEYIVSYFTNPMSRPAYYLPADRTGIMHAHKVVVGSLIQGASRAGLRPGRPLPVLSGVLADFLEQLIELGDLSSRRKRPKGNLAQRLEREILSGSIRIENSETGYPVFSYRQTGWTEDLPLMNTSSMVSELAPVVLYLRHVVSPGEVLIIEEPESHLHPAMQVAFIRHLAAAVRSGIRVIITTHSEWVLEELANLVRISDLPESRRKGIGGADYALRPDQVGTWLFEPQKRPKRSVVKEIPLDVDYGGFRSDYDDVAIGTHNDWATISSRIEES